jgi:Zn-finger nucleic acid-binding protein
MQKSEQILDKMLKLEADGETDTAEYKNLDNQYSKVRAKELREWTSNWKKNSKKISGGK